MTALARIADLDTYSPAPHTFTEFTGIEYLKIDIASSFGLDKENWEERILWTDTRIDFLEDLVNEAETPALYWAGIQALRRAQRGLPTGFPVSFDATASGMQLLACLTGCEASGRLCNLVPTGQRQDAYTALYGALSASVGGQMTISRKDTKRAIMTSLYGSRAVPKEVFGGGELLEAFFQTMETEAPGAWALNQALIQLWQPGALSHDWVLPDNFHAHVKVMSGVTRFVTFLDQPAAVHLKVNQGTKEGLSLGPNVIHSIDGMVVREMHRRCSYDVKHVLHLLTMSPARITNLGREKDRMVKTLWQHYLDSGFLSARILEHLDEENIKLVDQKPVFDLVRSLPNKPFPVISIHDCFRVHPNYANDLRRQYNRILSEIAASNLLSFVGSQIAGYLIPVTKMGDISKDILEADYTLS